MVPFRRRSGRTAAQLGGEATLLALDDCGLAIHDVQALYCGNVLRSHLMVGQRILNQIGETGIPVVNVANACATGATAFREGVLSVRSGAYDLVVAVGVEQMGAGLLPPLPSRTEGFLEEGAVGSLSTPAMFAQVGDEHSRRYGTTFEQFAKVAVKNHRHGTLNPKSTLRRETSLEEVMASDMIAYPNTKLMCSINTDGAAAAVIASEATAKRLGLMGRAIRVRASELTSSRYDARADALTDFNDVTHAGARAAFERAALGPEDLALVELHDCFATAELVHYENLGLCEAGGAGRLIDSGDTGLGGRLPVNVSGGLLSKGHPLGATGLANLYEIALHLRGEAGARQVAGARLGLAHVVGGGLEMGSCCAVHVLEKA
jgi:acetyl-CoA acetyltransferase